MKFFLQSLIVWFLSCSSLYSLPVFIVVHGTWGATSNWSKPGGDFFEQLQQSAQQVGATTVTFTWSGKLNNQSRRQAAQQLADFIRTYPPETVISLVTHSHGGNVGILASQELYKTQGNQHTIDAFYALATPVNTHDYMPAMNVIHKFYNIFSCEDLIQPIMGIFARVYPTHERITNIRILLDGKGPDHEQLHAPAIGRWLPMLHEKLAKAVTGNFQCFEFNKPGLIYFWSNYETPYYCTDHERTELLEKDARLMGRLLKLFIRKKTTL